METNLEELGLVYASSIELQDKALLGIAHDYDPKKGEWPQKRHNQHHTLNVIRDTLLIAELALDNKKIEPRTYHLLRIAAAYHDRYYRRGYEDKYGAGLNEEISAEMAVLAMDEYEVFTNSDKDAVWRYVMATEVQSFSPGIVSSADTEYDYAEGIIADGDLALFGNEFWPFISDSWNEYEELKGASRNPLTRLAFLTNVREMLHHHKWETEEAALIFPGTLHNAAEVINQHGILSRLNITD